MTRKLSPAQERFMGEVKTYGRNERPFYGGREAGRLACAWDRTAESLQRLGLVVIKRGAGAGAGAVAYKGAALEPKS